MEWTNEKVITFLETLKTEPRLWDPRQKNYKNRASQTEAWRRIVAALPFEVSIDEMKKKKESLMGYYRNHFNKLRKSLKSGKGDVYTTNWFAYETMDSFLREVYESNITLSTEINDSSSETQETSDGIKDGNDHMFSRKETSQNIPEGIRTPPSEKKFYQDYGRKRKVSDDMPTEIRAVRRQMVEAFQHMKETTDDEYETFGRLIACKLKKMCNPNTRDVLMNDIHNLVFRTCMADRAEQQNAVPQFYATPSSLHEEEDEEREEKLVFHTTQYTSD